MKEREDEILERVLEWVEGGGFAPPPDDLQPEERAIWREYAELAGLLAQGLDPVAPRVAARARLSEAVAGIADGGGADPFAATPGSAPLPFRAGPERSRPRGLRLLAAALAVVALGLAALAGWAIRDSRQQEARVAQLDQALADARQQAAGLEDAVHELTRVRRVLTAAGLRTCPLRPHGESPAQPVARGAVYFDQQGRRWVLTARDLEPCDKGSQYALWFIVDGRPVVGRTFHVQAGRPVTLAAEDMPVGATAIMLTLERDPQATEPKGPAILYGEESEKMF